MSVYYEKARELGQLLLESEQSKRLADARAYSADDTEMFGGELAGCEKDFIELVNKTVDIVWATATGEVRCGGCGRGCASNLE